MKFPTGRARLCVLAILFPAFGLAQNKVTFYTPAAKADQLLPRSCHDAGKVLVDVLNRYPLVHDWTFVVACDEKAWTNLMAYTNNTQDGNNIYGATSQSTKTIILRGPALVGGAPITGAHIITHELAHAKLGSGNETAAERQAILWMEAAGEGTTGTQMAGVR